MATRRVIGTWRSFGDQARAPVSGTVTFRPTVIVRDKSTGHIVVQDPVVVQLDPFGSIDIQLQVTSDPNLEPEGWQWEVTEQITSRTARRYPLLIPAGTAPFDLSAVEVPPSAVFLDPQSLYLKGVQVGPTTVRNPNQPPTVDVTSANSIATLKFQLPRAGAPAVGTVQTGTPAQGPDVTSSSTPDGDPRFNFRLPRSRNVQAGTTSMVNPDQPAALTTSQDGNGDLTLDLAVPRAADVTVGTVTVFNPDQNPDVLTTVTDGDVALDFGLPRASAVTVDTPAGVSNPDQQPAVSSTTTDGDVEIQFTLPRAAAVTVDEPATILNPDQQPAVGSTTTDGDVEIAFSLPRAPAVTVDTPATVLNPDQQPAVSSTTTDGDVEISFSLPAAPTFTVGDVITVGPSTPASTTDVGSDGNIVLDFDLPRGEKGWAPVFNIALDSDRRVLQVDDWVGGEGTKPATGDYVGATGLVSDIALAVDVRGPQGPSGTGALSDLSDVNLTTVLGGQIIQYDNASSNWLNVTPDTDDIAEGTNLYYTDGRVEAVIAGSDTDDLAEGATNLYYTDARVDAVIAGSDTDDLAEGAVNLYYTDGRAEAAADGRIAAATTDDLSEGATNLYYTDGRVDAVIAASDTDDLSEGATNLYFTDLRADDRADGRIAAADIDDLADVIVTTPQDGDILVYQSGDWVNQAQESPIGLIIALGG